MIAYMIQFHDNFPHVQRLISWLYHEDDLFVLSIDGNSSFSRDMLGPIAALDNVVIGPRHNISWGGFSIVQATLSSINTALKRDGWEYFINISAHDLPLITRDDMIARLRTEAAAGIYNFVSDFGPVDIEYLVDEPDGPQTRMAIKAGSNTKIELNGVTCGLMKPDTAEAWGFTPVTEPKWRPAFFVSEGCDGKFLSCRPFYRYEVELKKQFLSNNRYRFGRQWVTLHRQVCEALFEDVKAAEVYHFLRDSFIADEAFFQTLFGTEFCKRPKAGLKRNNFRYYFGAPSVVNDETYEKIHSSGSWFARKLDIKNSSITLEITDKLMTARGRYI